MEAQKLSRSVRPKHYELRIEPYIESATFDGSVTIEVDILEPTAIITLNVHKLAIRSTAVYDGEGSPIQVADTGGDSTLQTFSILFEQPLPAQFTIFIHQTFSGFLDKNGTGLHLTEADGSSMISTLFEPTYARTVFPCFDQPCFKATYTITLVVPGHMTCLGNTPIKSETVTSITSREKKTVEFNRTPPMSSYLIAFAVGEFNMIESHDFRIPIRAYAPRNYDVEHCRYVLGITAKVLTIYEKMFRLECGLEKADILAVPGSVGGMENWGLVTISTTVLFIDPGSSVAEKMAIAGLMAHEIAHQWFGNLVTKSSWEHFWLKEALADWAEISALEQLFGLPAWEEFVADKMQKAMFFDASRFSHALVASDAPLDPITYGKGISILRMLTGFVGKDVFLQAVRRFLLEHAYSNGNPEDLWEILRQISGSDVAAMVQTWTMDSGFPVINVDENEREGTITLTQSRFSVATTESTTSYPIFIEVLTSQGIIKEHLDEQPKVIKIPLAFYKLNPGQMGFYRVAYTSTRLQQLGDEVCKGTLSVEDRIGLITDTAALAFSGHFRIRTSDFLSLLQNFEDETSYFVWKVIIAALRDLSRTLLFEDQCIQNAFMDFRKHLVRRCLYRKGKFNESDDMDEVRFKALLFGNSGWDEKVVAAAEIMFEKFVAGDGNVLNPNIRAEVFEIVLTRGGKKEYNKLFDRFETSSGSTRKDIMRALGYSRNNACIKKTLKLATTPEILADVGLRHALGGLATHRKGIFALWRFIASGTWTNVPGLNLEKIAPVGDLILDSLTKLEYGDAARKYLQSVDSGSIGRDAERYIEGIEVRAAWLQRDRENLIGWLRRNDYYKHGPTRIGRSMTVVRDALEYLGCIG